MDPVSNPPPLPLSAYKDGPITLYHLESSLSIRPLWALEELSLHRGLTYKMKSFPRVRVAGGGTPGIFKASPMGLAPAVEIHPNPEHAQSAEIGSDTGVTASGTTTSATTKADAKNESEEKDPSSIVLTESRLILQWLSKNYAGSLWDHKTPQDALRDEYYAEFCHTALDRIDFVLILEIIPANLPFVIRPFFGWLFYIVAGMLKQTLTRIFGELEKGLANSSSADGQGKYLWFSSADEPGVADFAMTFPMDMAIQRGYLDLDKYPHLKGWVERRNQRPAWKNAMAKVGKYNLVTFQ